MAVFYFQQRDWQKAAQLWRRSVAATIKRVNRGALDTELTSKKMTEAERFGSAFTGLARAVYRLSPEGRAPDSASSNEMFQIIQWAIASEAAQSFAQMAARGSRNDPALEALVRERQDLVDEWQQREKTRAMALGQEAAKRDAKAESENGARMAAIDKHIEAIDERLKNKFPNFAALANPSPLSIEDVQAQLGADEALVLVVNIPEVEVMPGAKFMPEETLIWAVTKTQIRWIRSDPSDAAIAARRRLSGAGWTMPVGRERAARS